MNTFVLIVGWITIGISAAIGLFVLASKILEWIIDLFGGREMLWAAAMLIVRKRKDVKEKAEENKLMENFKLARQLAEAGATNAIRKLNNLTEENEHELWTESIQEEWEALRDQALDRWCDANDFDPRPKKRKIVME